MLSLNKQIKQINKKLDKLARKIEKKNFYETIELVSDTKNVMWRSFMTGVSKGIGMAIGFTILGAFVIYILRQVVMLNLPVIGAFVGDIMDIVEQRKKN